MFKTICNNRVAIKCPLSDTDKVFKLARGLGLGYQRFCLVMLSKLPYPTFNHFVLSLQSYKRILIAKREKDNQAIDLA